MLASHPQIKIEGTKEKHFWDAGLLWQWDKEPKWSRGIQDYDGLFPDAKTMGNDSITMEATPTVWHSAERDVTLPARVHSHMPWLKTVILIRNPLRWIVSSYLYWWANCGKAVYNMASWRECSSKKTAGDFHGWLQTGGRKWSSANNWDVVFFKSVKNWLRSFPLHTQTRVYRQEDLSTNTKEVTMDIIEFLDLSSDWTIVPKTVNAGSPKAKTEHLGNPPLAASSSDTPAHHAILDETRITLCKQSYAAFHQLGSLLKMDFDSYFTSCPRNVRAPDTSH